MVSLRSRFLMIVSFAAVLYGLPAHAQAQEGRLSGVVRDTTGAAVPGATVTVTNQTTNATQTVTSGADGSFSASLAPGTYSVTVALRGFGRQTKKDSRSTPPPRPPSSSPSSRSSRKRSRSRP